MSGISGGTERGLGGTVWGVRLKEGLRGVWGLSGVKESGGTGGKEAGGDGVLAEDTAARSARKKFGFG